VVAVVVDADLVVVLVVVIVTRRIGRSNTERTRRGDWVKPLALAFGGLVALGRNGLKIRVFLLFFSCKLVPMDLSKVC
jgi:hypothetical protein